jgi:tRNA G10  N-methylase Trm11
MEALLRSCPVLASDVSQKAVSGCTKNLEWLRKEEKILKKDVSSEVWKHDATKDFALKKLPDVVVTETTLGSPLMKRPSQKDANSERSENERLQEEFLRNAAAALPGVPLVCVWPVWRTKNTPVFLEKIWKVIEELPYEAVLPIETENKERKTVYYRRPDQFVGREVVLLDWKE